MKACPKCGRKHRTDKTRLLCAYRWKVGELTSAKVQIAELEAEVERLKAWIEELDDYIGAMYACGTVTGVEELYAEYQSTERDAQWFEVVLDKRKGG